MHTIGDIARTPLPRLKDKFRARFGKQSDIHAEVMWRTANGLDDSPVTPGTFNTPPKSVGHMMTLPRDYVETWEVNTILLELTEEVCRDCVVKDIWLCSHGQLHVQSLRSTDRILAPNEDAGPY